MSNSQVLHFPEKILQSSPKYAVASTFPRGALHFYCSAKSLKQLVDLGELHVIII